MWSNSQEIKLDSLDERKRGRGLGRHNAFSGIMVIAAFIVLIITQDHAKPLQVNLVLIFAPVFHYSRLAVCTVSLTGIYTTLWKILFLTFRFLWNSIFLAIFIRNLMCVMHVISFHLQVHHHLSIILCTLVLSQKKILIASIVLTSDHSTSGSFFYSLLKVWI